MSRDNEWGSHIELVALADIVGVPILVTTDSDDDEDFQVWIYSSEQHTDDFQVWIYPSEQHTDEVMLLGYSCNHYYSLEDNTNR